MSVTNARRFILVLLLTLGSAAQAQTVFRCVGPNGQPLFQQQACPDGNGAAVDVRPANTIEGNPSGDSQLRAEASRAVAVRSAMARGQLLNGMTDAEMRQVMGNAVTVNTDIINGRVSRQHVYRYPDGSTRYVYTNEAGVYGLQDRPATAKAAPEPCHSDLEMRNAEMGVSSVTISSEERARRVAQVDRMRRCRH